MDIIEKRKSDRFRIEEGAVVEFCKPRFLNIGKPRLVKSAPIVDIGKGGLAFEYQGQHMWSVDFNNLSIALAEDQIRIEKVPIKVISDKTVYNAPSTVSNRRCGVKFNHLTPDQKSRLIYLITHHTRERRPVQIHSHFRGINRSGGAAT